MHLYGHGSSGNVHKVQLLASFLNVTLQHTPTGFFGATATPEFRALNPNGKVPVLADGDVVVWESGAILNYLAHDTTWLPSDRVARAQVLQWMFFEQYSHEPFIATRRAIMHFDGPGPARDANMASKLQGATHGLDVMEQHLSTRDWFVGDAPTIADIALVSYTHVAHEGELELSEWPAVCKWIERMQALPGWRNMDGFDGRERN